MAGVNAFAALGESLYARVWEARRRWYAAGRATPERVSARVVSIGNLTVGGAGKTTCVLHLAREAARRGAKTAIVCRRYRPGPQGEGDEERMYGAGVPDARCHAGTSKRDLAREAAAAGAKLVLVDDGFSHWPLARDVDVVLLDATCPFGYERLLPRGLLREPPGGLTRAHAVVITRAERVDRAALDAVSAHVAALAPSALRAAARTVPLGWRRACDGAALELGALRGRRVVVWAGIGNPRAFAAMVRDVGAEVVAERFDRDHRPIAPAAVRDVLAAATARGATHVVVTRKDLVKIADPAALPESIVALDIDLEPTSELARVADLVMGTPSPA